MRAINSGPAQVHATIQKTNKICYVAYKIYGIDHSEIDSLQKIEIDDKMISHINFMKHKDGLCSIVVLNEEYEIDDTYCNHTLAILFSKIIKVSPNFRPDFIGIDWIEKGYKDRTEIRAFSNSLTSYLLTPINLSTDDLSFISQYEDDDKKLFYTLIYSILSIKSDIIKFIYLYQILQSLSGGTQNKTVNKVKELNKRHKLNIKDIEYDDFGNPEKTRHTDYLTYLRNKSAHCVDMFKPVTSNTPLSTAPLLDIPTLENDVSSNVDILLKVVFILFDGSTADQIKEVTKLINLR